MGGLNEPTATRSDARAQARRHRLDRRHAGRGRVRLGAMALVSVALVAASGAVLPLKAEAASQTDTTAPSAKPERPAPPTPTALPTGGAAAADSHCQELSNGFQTVSVLCTYPYEGGTRNWVRPSE